jgi:hypothetical protein
MIKEDGWKGNSTRFDKSSVLVKVVYICEIAIPRTAGGFHGLSTLVNQ